jgi:voltage-gated potassium channel Kch
MHTRYEAMYFSVVSVTTVGYGDEVCTTSHCKEFAIVYLVVGCLFVAAALADVAAFPIESRRQANELKVQVIMSSLLLLLVVCKLFIFKRNYFISD